MNNVVYNSAAIKPQKAIFKGLKGKCLFPVCYMVGVVFFQEAPAVTQVTECALACGMEMKRLQLHDGRAKKKKKKLETRRRRRE